MDEFFGARDCEEWSVSRKGSGVTIRSKSVDGRTAHAFSYRSPGFSERSFSTCDVLGARDRRREARRLRERGLTQAAIAVRLGVSQKTISNDLAARVG